MKSPEAEDFIEKCLQLTLASNPDVVRVEKESFGVEDARDISRQALEKPFGEKRIFILQAERFTIEAQNALLKTLEEPIKRVYFFIVSSQESIFLPTVLSRVAVTRLQASSSSNKFLQLPLTKRLEVAKEFDGSLPSFLDSLLADLKSRDVSLEILKKVFTVRQFASDPAVNSKLILDYLALAL